MEYVRLEVADGIGTIRLDRPPMNALNVQVQEELRQAARDAGDREDVRAVVVYGGPKVFAAGADIKEMAPLGYTEMLAISGGLQDALNLDARIPKPTVSAITGFGIRDTAVNADWRPTARSTMSAYDIVDISLTSAPAANTFGPP